MRLALLVAAVLVALLLLPSLPAHAGQRQGSVFVDDDLLHSGPDRAERTRCGSRSNAVGVYVG